MKFCLVCHKSIPNRNKYCSIECQKRQEYNEYIQQWKLQERDGMRGKYQLSMYVKSYILKKYNYKCAKCGWGEMNPFTQTIPLEIDHIDGNYKNNKEENLRALCPNCHSLTSTYKGANLHKGRKEREKYK